MVNNKKYIPVKKFNIGTFEDLAVARLRAENIDFRLRNSMISSVYPIGSMGVELEVLEDDVSLALSILEKMEADAKEAPVDYDHSDADYEDIEFEKNIHEYEKRLKNAKPPYLVFLIIILMCTIFAYFSIIMR